MKFNKILIANRGEIAIRIARAAADLGLETVAVFTQDDEACLHTRAAGSAHALPGRGARGYLDVEALIAAARATGCEAVHPGYGFLSERADFALACIEAGLTFIGPSPEHLELFGDKTRARAAARAAGVPILDGVEQAVSLEEAQAFLARRPAGEGIILKAVAGGGGRGTRVVMTPEDVAPAYARCRSEAAGAFGVPDIYVEAFLPRARHIEVQLLVDQGGAVTDLGERDCSLQRRFQKVVEIAPAPNLPEAARKAIIAAALRLASDTR
ncbi:biotin carboxylase N-terminal domain-containing protein, partial [Phenylobacterium sp.]|uniref:biotin carboxylase N-terminal domain-containing protein n=1 Tax=Phenylobacterium sp. TaxID=1871053 RepID=UPI0025EBD928